MKPFFFIYLDEYGNSGNRLDDPQQPIFGLQYAFVPADERWAQLEDELLKLAEEIRDKLALSETPKLHAVELFSRNNKHYRKLSPKEAYSYVVRVLQIAQRLGVSYYGFPVYKKALAKFLQITAHKMGVEGDRILAVTKNGTRFPTTLKIAMFPVSYMQIEDILQRLDAYGVILFDQERRDQDEFIAASHVYKAMRRKKLINRILENPVKRNGRYSFPLATADFSGYVYFGAKRNELLAMEGAKVPKRRRVLAKWSRIHVEPNLLRFASSDARPIDSQKEIIRSIALSQVFLFNKMQSYDTTLEILDRIISMLEKAPGP